MSVLNGDIRSKFLDCVLNSSVEPVNPLGNFENILSHISFKFTLEDFDYVVTVVFVPAILKMYHSDVI